MESSMMDRFGGFHLVQSELSKIQRWKVATQMDLDAKETKVRHVEILLQQLSGQLKKEQRQVSQLQDKYEAKCRESNQLQEQLKHEASVYQILEQGIRKLDGRLILQENFIVVVKELNEQKQRETLALNSRLEEVMIKLEKLSQTKTAYQKENTTLKQDLASLKKDLLNTLSRLSDQASQCEALQNTLENTNKDLNESMDRIKSLEDTIDCKDRDIDIIKDNHLKEMNSLRTQAKSLESDLSVSEKRKEELNASLVQLSKDREQLAEDYENEKITAETIFGELITQNVALESRLAQLDDDLAERENKISLMEKEQQDEAATNADKLSKLKVELDEKNAAFRGLVEDKDIAEKQKVNLEKELGAIKKVHKELKLLKIDYERTINIVKDRDGEIHKLRQIQVQKLDQDEEMAKLKKEIGLVEEKLSKLCTEKISLESRLSGESAKVEQMTTLLQAKEAELEKFRQESLLDATRDEELEKRYRQKLEEVEKEKIATERDLREMRASMEQVQASLDHKISELNMASAEILSMKEDKSSMEDKIITLEKQLLLAKDASASRIPSSGDGIAPREPKAATSRKSGLFHDFDVPSLSPPSDRSDAEVNGSSFSSRLQSRNKRRLDDDFDTFIKNCESKPKTYEPKKKRMFFKRSKK